jgi:hypothetical protein
MEHAQVSVCQVHPTFDNLNKEWEAYGCDVHGIYLKAAHIIWGRMPDDTRDLLEGKVTGEVVEVWTWEDEE